jgi:hypothetical protein
VASRQRNDASVWEFADYAQCGIDAAEVRQHEIHDNYIRPQAPRGEYCFLARHRGTDDRHAIVAIEKNSYSLPHHAVVVYH